MTIPELTPLERQMLALAIFTMSMKIGPSSFGHFESIVEKTGIETEFVAYASSWINYKKDGKKEV
jgi:hypothetical protein